MSMTCSLVWLILCKQHTVGLAAAAGRVCTDTTQHIQDLDLTERPLCSQVTSFIQSELKEPSLLEIV